MQGVCRVTFPASPAHRPQVCPCLAGQLQGGVHEMPFRPESHSSPSHTHPSETSSWDLISHAIMPLTTEWLTMVGTVFPSVTSLFPRCTLCDAEWVNTPGTCSNSLYLVFLRPAESLPPSQQVTHHLESSPELPSSCACHSPCPHYARLANTARVVSNSPPNPPH